MERYRGHRRGCGKFYIMLPITQIEKGSREVLIKTDCSYEEFQNCVNVCIRDFNVQTGICNLLMLQGRARKACIKPNPMLYVVFLLIDIRNLYFQVLL